MNIQIANRLLAYRKAKGLSQEELAERIGVSRQAVSKWERSESSPDTDNLIALAELYGVTIDEMIKGTEPPRTEQAEKEESDETDGEFEFNEEQADTKVHIGRDGIRVNDGGDKVLVNSRGVFVQEEDGTKVHVGWSGIHVSGTAEEGGEDEDDVEWDECRRGLPRWLNISFPIIILVSYLLLGFLIPGFGWRCCWTLFLLIPIEGSVSAAIARRKLSAFAYPLLCAFGYLSYGMICGIWSPMWVVFLTIPIFYVISHEIDRRYRNKKSEKQ